MTTWKSEPNRRQLGREKLFKYIAFVSDIYSILWNISQFKLQEWTVVSRLLNMYFQFVLLSKSMQMPQVKLVLAEVFAWILLNKMHA